MVSRSPTSANEPRHAGLYYDIEPDPRRDSVPNLLHGVFRQGRKLKRKISQLLLLLQPVASGSAFRFCFSKEELAKSFGSPRPDCSRHASASR
jgi:hypothetical protein